jgi:hypothetical protein
LVFDHKSSYPYLFESLFPRKCKQRKFGVGIDSTLIRTLVVSIVSIDPARIAKAEKEIGTKHANEIVCAGRTAYLAVAGIVDNEPCVYGHKCQEAGGTHFGE